jgi:5-amino-6-(5-phosphoribosylamino)uracil reductase
MTAVSSSSAAGSFLAMQLTDLADDALRSVYAWPDAANARVADARWVRANFVATVDGAATRRGTSADLGGPGDLRVLETLRELADVVLVGARTITREGYGRIQVPREAAARRRAAGLTPHPRTAVISRTLSSLPPDAHLLADSPAVDTEPPLVYTTTAAPRDRVAAVAASGAEIVEVADGDPELPAVLADLAGRGRRHILTEGGPSLFAALIAHGLVDELCLTVTPALAGPGAPRIVGTGDESGSLTPLHLASVLRDGSELYTRWMRS